MNSDTAITDDLIDRLKRDAETVFRAALAAVDPARAIARWCRRQGEQLHIQDRAFDLSRIRRVLVVGAGKATAAMARAVEQLLGDRIDQGLISVKYGHTLPLARIDTMEAGHPLPDANGMQAAQRILAMVQQARADDLVIVLISGGGSALLPLPVPNVLLAEKVATTDQLLRCGATIHEINALRKHLSAIKGGRLARAAAPASIITLMLSDVVGDQPDVIASGPTAPDGSTFGDCLDIVRRYDLDDLLPAGVREHLAAGAAGRHEETPKVDTHAWDHVHNRIVAGNGMALQAAAQTARRLGYRPLVLTSRLEGEARTVARVHAAIARQVADTGEPAPPPVCLLSGGETTVVVKGEGRGGRNQEFALAAALAMADAPAMMLLAAGTDGSDGPTDAAGAFADPTTVRRAAQAGMDARRHLMDNDAYPFFDRLGDLLRTGPTGTNVMDLNIFLCPAANGASRH